MTARVWGAVALAAAVGFGCAPDSVAPPRPQDVVSPRLGKTSEWRLTTTPERARLQFVDTESGAVGFELGCRPDSERIGVSSRFLRPGFGKSYSGDVWGVRVDLASKPWTRSIGMTAHPRSPRHAEFASYPDDPLLRQFERTGVLSQVGPAAPAVDLSAETDAERATIKAFFESCRSEYLRGLDPREAEADAQRALAAGDGRLLGYHAYNLKVPGVDFTSWAAMETFGAREIGSNYGSRESHRLIVSYIVLYNRAMVAARPEDARRAKAFNLDRDDGV